MLHLNILFGITFCLAKYVAAEESPKVVIVGAGAAGLAAAVELVEKGWNDVTILEAEDRIGGRIHTVKLGDHWVDMGAQWVAGESGNPVWEMAWPLGELAHSDDTFNTFHFFLSNGNAMDIDMHKQLTDHFIKLYLSGIKNENNETFDKIGQKELDKFFAEHPDWEHKNALSHWVSLMIAGAESADSWHDFIPDDLDWGVPGDMNMDWKDKGFSWILDIMMKKYPDPTKALPIMDKVKLNKEVTKVDYTDEAGKVKIHTKDGQVFEADDVIMTTSLGVLKATHDTMFNPPLSNSKKLAIENLGFGDVTKIYLLFDKPWWKEHPKTNGWSILWSKNDIEERQNNPEKEWQLHLLGFFKVKNNILEMWITGKGARDVETMPEDKLMGQIMELMQIIKEDKTVEAPKKMLRSMWHSNEHFRGSNSYRSTDSWKHGVKMEHMEKPVPKDKPRIWFAGEATDEKSYASVNGAIDSGRREARKLMAKYGTNDA